MPTNRKPIQRHRRTPPLERDVWLWCIGREAEAYAIHPYREYSDDEERALWAEHAEAITRAWQQEHPDGPKKPPIQQRVERARKNRVTRADA